jgi:hypothetical protein
MYQRYGCGQDKQRGWTLAAAPQGGRSGACARPPSAMVWRGVFSPNAGLAGVDDQRRRALPLMPTCGVDGRGDLGHRTGGRGTVRILRTARA